MTENNDEIHGSSGGVSLPEPADKYYAKIDHVEIKEPEPDSQSEGAKINDFPDKAPSSKEVQEPAEIEVKPSYYDVLTEHQCGGAADPVQVYVMDKPGNGGASHKYLITWGCDREDSVEINFQNGGVAENGHNGVTQEALLAVVAHRLKGFLSGKFPSAESKHALHLVQQAIAILHKRTLDRKARGVEGRQLA